MTGRITRPAQSRAAEVNCRGLEAAGDQAEDQLAWVGPVVKDC
jgi:hypothetical protein